MIGRRQFLKILIGLAGSGAPAISMARPKHEILIQHSPLAGFHYHHAERLWSWLQVGQPLSLVREPANPHDPRAVRIDWRGWKLGYLPRVENTAISQMMDHGKRIKARIIRLKESKNPWDRVQLEIKLEMIS